MNKYEQRRRDQDALVLQELKLFIKKRRAIARQKQMEGQKQGAINKRQLLCTKHGVGYDNHLVLSPDGLEMFRCNLKKVRWYLKRQLAEIVDKQNYDGNDYLIIKLKFTPRHLGNYNDIYYLQYLHSRCCVCGNEDKSQLTRHHIVPICFRKHMLHSKNRSNHDVLLLCNKCHNIYEKHAQSLKYRLYYKFKLKFNTGHSAMSRLLKSFCLHGDKMPQEKNKSIAQRLEHYFKLSIAELKLKHKHIINTKYPKFGEIIINNIGETKYQQFTVMWRKHFVNQMSPRYLPKHWHIHKSHCREQ